MIESLELFSPHNLLILLAIVLMAWLIWPVVCGILGAMKGQAWQGVMHGLFWGPIGLIVVLYSRKKHVCPTCGQKTLSDLGRPVPRAIVMEPLPAESKGAEPDEPGQIAPPPVIHPRAEDQDLFRSPAA